MTGIWWFGWGCAFFIFGYLIGQKIRWVRAIDQVA